VLSFKFIGKVSIYLSFGFCENYKKNFILTARSGQMSLYEGWNFNSGNYLFTTDTK